MEDDSTIECLSQINNNNNARTLRTTRAGVQRDNFVYSSSTGVKSSLLKFTNNYFSLHEKWRMILFFTLVCFKPTYGSHNDSSHFIDFKFIVEPQDTVVLKDSPARLDCAVTGNPEVQWKRDGILLDLFGDERRTVLGNGSLYFTVIHHTRSERPDEGLYQCVAKLKGVGVIVSRTAKVQVASLPRFDEEPRNLTIFPGQTARFSCRIQGTPTPQITWLKDEQPMVLDLSRMIILPSGALEIDDVTSSDSGGYRCDASNVDKHRLSSPGWLIVNEDLDESEMIQAPSFVDRRHSSSVSTAVVQAHSSVTLDCAANGDPRPTIVWLKDGITIDLADLDSRFRKIGVGNLQISEVNEGDEGNYHCRAENSEDSSDASTILEVQVTPHFVKSPKDAYAHEKDEVELECQVYGKPEPTLRWMKNGDVIIESEYFRIINGNNLRILGLVESDGGIYQCMASNPAGNIQASAQLIVVPTENLDTLPSLHLPSILGQSRVSFENAHTTKDVPSEPRDLKAVFISTHFVTLTWKPPIKSHGEIMSYSVFYRQDDSQRERIVNATQDQLSIDVNGLQPKTKYYIRVTANNRYGVGAATPDITVLTQPQVHIPGPPIDVQAAVQSPTSILVRWNVPQKLEKPINNYTIFYIAEDDVEEQSVTTDETHYELKHLDKFKLYSIYVVANDENGAGLGSKEVSVRTFSAEPDDVPQNVTVEATSSKSVVVRWEPPPDDKKNGVITGYKIRYKVKGRRRGMTVTTDGNRRMYSILNLEKGAEYVVKLSALNVNGSGPATAWIPVETFQTDLPEDKVPEAPSSIQARAMVNSIIVMWSPPKDQTVMIKGYTIGYGIGIPDIYKRPVDNKQRYYNIENLEPNSEYVISVRAFNSIGFGQPIYEKVRTRDVKAPERTDPMTPPLGLQAEVLTASSVMLQWTDSTLPKHHFAQENNRFYTVRYRSRLTSKYRYLNTTKLSCVIDDLRPDTLYEFSVKVTKGRRDSNWSLMVLNTTQEAAPGSAPRDLTIVPHRSTPTIISLNWQPPKHPNGKITGFVISYTTSRSKDDTDWVVEAVVGDYMTTTIHGLTPNTNYYFKIQARNKKGYGPFSGIVSFRTVHGVEASAVAAGNGHDQILYISIGVGVTVLLIISGVIGVVCLKRKCSEPERNRKGYSKGPKTKTGKCESQQPPDLWCSHQDQLLEMKGMQQNNVSVGSGGPDWPMTVTPIVRHSQEMDEKLVSVSTLDKRNQPYSYLSGTDLKDDCPPYVAARRPVKPRPIMIPIDSQPPKEPVATAVVNGDANPRHVYPRAQYTVPRAHVTVDPNSATVNNVHISSDSTSSDLQTSNNYSALSTLSSTDSGGSTTLPKRGQGHPLKSFGVPVPPPHNLPSTPQSKHNGSASPFKKSFDNIRSKTGLLSPGKCDLKPPTFIEESNAEMAVLDDIMKDLSAITANEYEC